MNYTAFHIYGNMLSDDVIHAVQTDANLPGNRPQDFGFESSVTSRIDYAWTSLRNDWQLFAERSTTRDPYGTTLVRKVMTRFLSLLDYELDYQPQQVSVEDRSFDIPYLADGLDRMPVIIVGDRTGDAAIDTLDRSSLDFRAKGANRRKSPHATMLDYLNSTDNIYGILTNGLTLRIVRNTGQLVKLTYLEFDLRRMVEEDLYAEFALMFRLLHASRFRRSGDEASVMERWFNQSIDSGNRIRAGLSTAVEQAMATLGRALVAGEGAGNEALQGAILSGELTAAALNKELVHFIYRLLFLFIIEDRGLVYTLPAPSSPSYDRLARLQEVYMNHYAASRLRRASELPHLRDTHYHDLWEGLMETFRLFEDEAFGSRLAIAPMGGVLFNADTLRWTRSCRVDNATLLAAIGALNEFRDDRGQRVKINYASLDVEEFGSVYEGILELRAVVVPADVASAWQFSFGTGQDRKASSSYYTRPDLVQSLIRTTLEPVIKERIKAAPTKEEKIASLLSMRVCDAACGSGHIVLAMARTIAWYVSSLRTGEDNPASMDYREALREVIQRCVYAVDFNPDAVELCKVVLWIEGYCAGHPLSFLDAHIRCGNSVVGVTDLNRLLDGVPQEAFAAADKDTLKKIKSLNAEALRTVDSMRQGTSGGWYVSTLFDGGFSFSCVSEANISLADNVREIEALPEDTLSERNAKESLWQRLMESPRVECLRRAADIFTYAFYRQFTDDDQFSEVESIPPLPYTRSVYHALQQISAIDSLEVSYTSLSGEFCAEVADAAERHRFFHWAIEFPEVFADGGGFDVMCGNPPWDKIKVEDKKWFESHGRPDIVNAGTAAQRKRAIAELPVTDPELYAAYRGAQAEAEAMSRFVRFSGRFPLTATGDIDLYPLFAEHNMRSSREAWGLVMPTGIAVNDTNKDFFGKLIEDKRLISIYDFENREKLFDIDTRYKFCLLTAGKAQAEPRRVSGGFYLTRLDHLLDPARIYSIDTADFARLNPNTKTCPVFRTSRDAELTAKIYRNATILVNETTGDNPWGVKFMSMIHMSNDSHLFRTHAQLRAEGAVPRGNHFILNSEEYVPLYEGKMFWLYNHHFGTWPTDGPRPNTIDTPPTADLANPASAITHWYWVPLSAVDSRKIKTDRQGNTLWQWRHQWLQCFRMISNATNERTFIMGTIPDACGVGNSATLLFAERGTMPAASLQGMMSSLVFDFATRQKMGGSNMSGFIVEQLPVLTPEQIEQSGFQRAIVERVARLVWFNHDMDGWMKELRAECPPEWDLPTEVVVWDEAQRAVWQAELDAIFAHLYGLSFDELRYILDPEDVLGPGCINETFRVLRDREMRELGEYRTRRLVIEDWHRLGFPT